MAIILALEKLYDDCVARFGQEGTFGITPTPQAAAQAANHFGWREPTRQLRPLARIEWVPGDPQGDAGQIAGAKYPGRATPDLGRPLATLVERFTVYVHGYDNTAPRNERAQWKATRLLYDAWYRAVYLAAYGTFQIASTRWLTEKTEQRFGATLQVVCLIESMIPDAVITTAPVDTAADITVTELSVTDPTFEVVAST